MFKCDRFKAIVVFVTRKPDSYVSKKLLCEEDILARAGRDKDGEITVSMVDKVLLE
jgi:hypothetical protein